MNSKIYKVTPHFSKNALLHPSAIPLSKSVRGMSYVTTPELSQSEAALRSLSRTQFRGVWGVNNKAKNDTNKKQPINYEFSLT